jgi:hypothetical protein
MLPSNSNSHNENYDPIPFSTELENNSASMLQSIYCDLPDSPFNLSFFHHFPSNLFEDYQNNLLEETPHDFLFQFQPQSDLVELDAVVSMEMDVSINESKDKDKDNKVVPKKGASTRRDRHSKIKTARGMRDRRMRLSVQVAKRFFRLQDMLGFEKASKTVEWLLNQAKGQINQIAAAKSSNVSSSTFEYMSSPEEIAVNEIKQEQKKKKKKPLGVKRIIRKNHSRIHNPLARELREKARERARERTKNKNMRRSMVFSSLQEVSLS